MNHLSLLRKPTMKNVKTVRTFLISLAGVVCITSTIVFLTGPQSDEYDAHIPPISKNTITHESRVPSQPSLDYDPPEQIQDFDSRVKSEPSVDYEPIVDYESRGKSEQPSVDSAQVIRLLEDVAAQSKALKEYVELVRNLNEEMISTKSALSLQIEERKKKVEEEMKVFRAASSKTTNVASKDGDSKKGLGVHTDIGALLKQNYLGCHVDSFVQRDMPVYLPSFTQTPAKCMKACFDQGHKYAGLQNGGECWCGPDAPRQRRLDDISCKLPCSGDQSMMCGGELRNSVYKAVNIGLQNDTLLIKRPFELANAGSSVTCQGNNKDTRVCKFRNLYYDTSPSLSRNRIFIFYRGPGTIIVNLEEVQNAKSGEFVVGIMELTSITGIIGMDIRVIDLPSSLDKVENSHDLPFLRYKDVRVVPGSSSLFARFLPFNIMHHLHDDLMNLFMTLVEFSSPHYSSNGVSTRAPYDTQTRLVVMDGHVAGGYSSLLQTLSDVSVTAISEISSIADSDARESSLIEGPSSSSQVPGSNVLEGGKGNLIQFETAVTGVTRHCNWYQYGFNIPQGPLEDKEVDGHLVRMFANFVLSRLPPLKTLPVSTPLMVDARDAEPRVRDLKVTDPEQRYIAIFSRTLNRKILNEPELAEALEVAYPHLKVVIVRLEETPLPVLMRVIERTSIGIGMHGSILILALFMPKGSLLVEMYPYAVPAENYTPYKTLAGLKNMDMKYAAWENNYKENNIEYPNRPRLQGGVSHLAPAELKAVTEARWVPKHKCCEDPTWLFRIYQDTRVHVAEVLDLIRSKGIW